MPSILNSDINRALSMAVTLVIISFLTLGLIATLIMVFGGVFGSETPRSTPDPPEQTELPDSTAFEPTIAPTATPTAMLETTPTPTLSPTLTPAPQRTPTQLPSPSSSATATPEPYTNERYSDFVAAVFGEAEVDANVPINIRGWEVVEGNVLIIAMNLTARSEDELRRVRQVNTLVTSGFTQTIIHYDNGKIDGKIPDRLRIAEVNNTGASPKTLYINTSLARDYYLNNLNAPEFTDHYWDTERNLTREEEEFIRLMDKRGGNVTLYNKTAE